jgi:hypothetical protein
VLLDGFLPPSRAVGAISPRGRFGGAPSPSGPELGGAWGIRQGATYGTLHAKMAGSYRPAFRRTGEGRRRRCQVGAWAPLCRPLPSVGRWVPVR